MKYKYDRKNISNYLKLLRINAGLSMYKLANILGVTRMTISHIENGYNNPSVETLKKYSDYFKEEITI